MKRYNREVIVSGMEVMDKTCCTADDGLSVCSPTQVEEAWDLPETNHGTDSSYEYQSITSEIEEASVSSSDIKDSNEEENDKVGSLDKKLSKQYPTISLSSHNTVVSDITDADCFSPLRNNGADLQKEIDALRYIVSKSKYFSSKEISKRLTRLEELAKEGSQWTTTTESSHTREGSQRTRDTDSSQRTRDTESSVRTRETESSQRSRDTESITKTTKKNHRKARKPRKQRPKKALSTSILESSPSDDFEDVKKQLSAHSLPTNLLEEEEEEKPPKTKRKGSRKPRPSSMACNHAGEITEEFTYRPRPSKPVVKTDSLTLKAKKNGSDPKKKKRRNRLIGRENLCGTMVKRAAGSSSSRTTIK